MLNPGNRSKLCDISYKLNLDCLLLTCDYYYHLSLTIDKLPLSSSDLQARTLKELAIQISYFALLSFQLEQEKASLLQHIHEIEEQHKETVSKLQRHVQEKEKLLAAEFAEAEQVYKTTEHDLRERLEEKTQIIEVISYKFMPLFQTEKMLPFEKFNHKLIMTSANGCIWFWFISIAIQGSFLKWIMIHFAIFYANPHTCMLSTTSKRKRKYNVKQR